MKHGGKWNDPLYFPTFGDISYIERWLDVHRKSNRMRREERIDELGRMQICTNPGCGLISRHIKIAESTTDFASGTRSRKI